MSIQPFPSSVDYIGYSDWLTSMTVSSPEDEEDNNLVVTNYWCFAGDIVNLLAWRETMHLFDTLHGC
jgi:hypothetical protein